MSSVVIILLMREGLYLAFEGVVGSGKTTQSKLLYRYLKGKFPEREIIWTREPGGDEIAEAIRKVVQGTEFQTEMEPVCEQYLYAASRAQTLRRLVKPVLDKRGVVVSDRSVFTSMAFQGFGRGLGLEKVLEINRLATEGLYPDKVLIINLEPKIGLTRINDHKGDKFERLDLGFFEKVRKGYLTVALKYPDTVVIIEGDGSIDEVQSRVVKAVEGLF